jgi:phosphoglycolate phosphatase
MNVLFDLDGTLTDPKEGIITCFKYALDRLGVEAPAGSELQQFIGPSLQESFATLFGAGQYEAVNRAVSLYRDRFATQGVFEIQIYPGVKQALTRLRDANCSLYLATAKPHIFAERIVERFGLAHCFREVYGSELDGTNADKSDLIGHILRVEPLTATETIMVGDRSHDMIGARSNGVFAVGALWGYGSKAELVSTGASALCESPSDLPRLLLSLSASGVGG